MGKNKSYDEDDDDELSSDALDGHGTISEWEKYNGRGFWGCSAHGYIYDDDQNDR
jgi:hypothetical protein